MPLRLRQNRVVVRVDLILYGVLAVASVLVLASLLTDVDAALVTALLTFAGSVFAGWLTYLWRCSRNGRGQAGDE